MTFHSKRSFQSFRIFAVILNIISNILPNYTLLFKTPQQMSPPNCK